MVVAGICGSGALASEEAGDEGGKACEDEELGGADGPGEGRGGIGGRANAGAEEEGAATGHEDEPDEESGFQLLTRGSRERSSLLLGA